MRFLLEKYKPGWCRHRLGAATGHRLGAATGHRCSDGGRHIQVGLSIHTSVVAGVQTRQYAPPSLARRLGHILFYFIFYFWDFLFKTHKKGLFHTL